MASSARTMPRRLGQLAAQSRLSSPLQPRLTSLRPWVCRQCSVQKHQPSVAVAGRRFFTHSPATSTPVTGEDVNSVPHSRDAISSYTDLDTFPRRHIGPDDADTALMLKALTPPVANLDEFVAQVIPADILTGRKMDIGEPYTEAKLVKNVQELTKVNKVAKCYIGQGYYGTHTPGVIQRNVLENPAWYTSYTPYQPEISQGRLESLVNYQTMVTDLTALPIANASLLDEGTAAAEAMTLSMNMLSTSRAKRAGKTFVVSTGLHPQTISVLRGRADGFGIRLLELDVADEKAHAEIKGLGDDLVGVMVQYPDTYGGVYDFQPLADLVHQQGALLSAATDLLALTHLKPPGEWGADIAFGNAQRLGVPMGMGGPHAAFFAVADKYKRKIPGRLVGLSKDRMGDKAYRLALQTREQHIRREKATSNVCTAQALLANMSALYGVYHGPEGLKAIAERAIRGARAIQLSVEEMGYKTIKSAATSHGRVLFDTVIIDLEEPLKRDMLLRAMDDRGIALREVGAQQVGISIDETTTLEDLETLADVMSRFGKEHMGQTGASEPSIRELLSRNPIELEFPASLERTSSFMTHPVFNTHHSETELLRYIHHLQSKDLSLVHSMIPLGSCTMKLNGTTEMSLITLPEISKIHPHAPEHHTRGFVAILEQLKDQLSTITGMDAATLQPNSGAQGEFAGLRAIRDFHLHHPNGDKKRDICLIPVSAHGTNPASAAMAGMRVVTIKCHPTTGNLDLEDLKAKCTKYEDQLGAIMVTYPSTFGVFEPEIRKVCDMVHEHGGQVYMDGANMNAQIGLCSPGDIGADVCHLNLHKTFCIPHGGGGPGVGPICVKEHLAPFLPSDARTYDVEMKTNGKVGGFPVSSAKEGSASINLISWAYNSLMGADGLTHATKMTLLNANYILSRLSPHYKILYTNEAGRCAHEFILDARPFKETAGVEAIDIAKRLQDYGFHAPTMSWPVANTLMIEPTESESKEELDRFIDSLISIREEIREVEEGKAPRERNVLKMSPHPMQDLIMGDGGEWDRSYSRAKAAYPLPWLREKKFWPSVGRIDDTYGDMNLFCTCPPVQDTVEDN